MNELLRLFCAEYSSGFIFAILNDCGPRHTTKSSNSKENDLTLISLLKFIHLLTAPAFCLHDDESFSMANRRHTFKVKHSVIAFISTANVVCCLVRLGRPIVRLTALHLMWTLDQPPQLISPPLHYFPLAAQATNTHAAPLMHLSLSAVSDLARVLVTLTVTLLLLSKL